MEKSSDELGLELDELNKLELEAHLQLDAEECFINLKRNELDEIRKEIRSHEDQARKHKQTIRTLKTQIRITDRAFWKSKDRERGIG